MSLILSIDTSTEIGSVALHDKSQLLCYEVMRVEKSHAEFIHLVIERIMKQVGQPISALSAVAISAGPGSYTGMRIGLSVAKGLCFSLDIPLIAIPTLKILATSMQSSVPHANIYIPMIDARRMEVYCAIFDRQLNYLQTEHAHILTSESFSAYINQPGTTVAGNGIPKFQSILPTANALFIPDLFPLAVYMGKWAFESWNKKAFEDVAYFEPFYLKEFYTTQKKSTNE
jgi:tRNA threonylcarbamoyladenosine biosynthesis protein TsaB